MYRALWSICLLGITALTAFSQGSQPPGTTATKSAPIRYDAEIALAKSALEAHGGAKFRNARTTIFRGSVDVTTSAFTQAIPATFVMIFSGDKYRFELANPVQPFKQVYDGVNTSATIRGGMTLPPINRLGFPLLPKIGETGFVITPLPEGKRKRKGFRMTSPEGYFTDFYLDEKTNQVKGYDSSYVINGRTVTTSVEIDRYRLVDGVLLPEKYVQRFDTEQMTVYADFKTKEIKVNAEVPDSLFSIDN